MDHDSQETPLWRTIPRIARATARQDDAKGICEQFTTRIQQENAAGSKALIGVAERLEG